MGNYDFEDDLSDHDRGPTFEPSDPFASAGRSVADEPSAPRRTNGDAPSAPRRTSLSEVVAKIVELQGGGGRREKDAQAAEVLRRGYDAAIYRTVNAYLGSCVEEHKKQTGEGSLTWAKELWAVGECLEHGFGDTLLRATKKDMVRVARALNYLVDQGHQDALKDQKTQKQILALYATIRRASDGDAGQAALIYRLVTWAGDLVEEVPADNADEAREAVGRNFSERLGAGERFRLERFVEGQCVERLVVPDEVHARPETQSSSADPSFTGSPPSPADARSTDADPGRPSTERAQRPAPNRVQELEAQLQEANDRVAARDREIRAKDTEIKKLKSQLNALVGTAVQATRERNSHVAP
jgi:hypothetical protein